ncbi:hypothetical protein D9M71_352520 [compost metagenome]
MLQHPVQRGGHHHAAEGRRDRQCRHAWFVQFAEDKFALELQGDQEKEQRHQGVVDPAFQRTRVFQRAESETTLNLPDAEERMRPGRVGEDQGGDGEHQEDASGGGFDVQEVGERLGQPVGRYLRQFDVFSIGLPVSTH